MNRTSLSIGDRVIFGNGRGEKTLGEIVKLNPKRAKVKTLEARGSRRLSSAGAVWTVPYSLISPASDDMKPQEKVSREARYVRDYSKQTQDFAKGDRVWFVGKGSKKITGTVIRVSKKTCSVEPDDGRTRYWRVPPSMLKREGETVATVVPLESIWKRSEEAILRDLCNVECSLSPENLSCDGELSRYQTQRRYNKLMAEKRALIKELGRTPTDSEVWGVSFN
jgi:hypothetical protein